MQVPAHSQSETIRLHRMYPDHAPRSGDPDYHLFEAVKRRMQKAGLYVCAINNADCGGELELHHAFVEFAYQNDIDVTELDKHLGLHLGDADFAAWVESPANLEVFCRAHHVGVFGVHLIPTADWEVVRDHKAGSPPVEVIQGT